MIAFALYDIAACYLLWVLYLAYSALDYCWKELPIATKVLAVPVLLAGVIVDITFNIFLGSVLFLDLPKEATLSQRMSRLKKGGGWRAIFAQWACASLLDPFQINGHCSQE